MADSLRRQACLPYSIPVQPVAVASDQQAWSWSLSLRRRTGRAASSCCRREPGHCQHPLGWSTCHGFSRCHRRCGGQFGSLVASTARNRQRWFYSQRLQPPLCSQQCCPIEWKGTMNDCFAEHILGAKGLIELCVCLVSGPSQQRAVIFGIDSLIGLAL